MKNQILKIKNNMKNFIGNWKFEIGNSARKGAAYGTKS